MNRHNREEVKAMDGGLRGKLLLRHLHSWDARATADFEKIPFDTIEADIELYRRAVDSGKCRLGEICEESTGERVGTLLYAASNGVFLIAMAAMNDDAGYDRLLEAGERRAKELGCKTLRVDAERPGILKKLLEAGYLPCKVALTKEL